MPKVRIEQASDATINPPHPGDPTSHVTRDGGEPLHKAPMPGWDPETGRVDEEKAAREREERAGERVKAAAVPGDTGRDAAANGQGGEAQSPFGRAGEEPTERQQEWRDDPMPEDARERLDWVQRGTDTGARINAALRAEEARGHRKRPTVMSGLQKLREEHHQNERHSSTDSSSEDNSQ